MSRSKCVRVFESSARTILRHVKRAEALEMVERREAFVLSNDPLEIALTRKPTRKETDGRPDLSLTISPGVLLAAAAGSKRSREAVESRRTMRHVEVVSESLLAETHKGSILYFPNEGKLMSKGKNAQLVESLESPTEGN